MKLAAPNIQSDIHVHVIYIPPFGTCKLYVTCLGWGRVPTQTHNFLYRSLRSKVDSVLGCPPFQRASVCVTGPLRSLSQPAHLILCITKLSNSSAPQVSLRTSIRPTSPASWCIPCWLLPAALLRARLSTCEHLLVYHLPLYRSTLGSDTLQSDSVGRPQDKGMLQSLVSFIFALLPLDRSMPLSCNCHCFRMWRRDNYYDTSVSDRN